MTASAHQLRLLPHPEEDTFSRSQRLMSEARSAANDHVAELTAALARVADLANDVGRGGDVYPVGVRDLAAKIGVDAAWCGQTMRTIMHNLSRWPVHPEAEQEGLASAAC